MSHIEAMGYSAVDAMGKVGSNLVSSEVQLWQKAFPS
jgi:hypothetical protein